jgi:hypothetical protein
MYHRTTAAARRERLCSFNESEMLHFYMMMEAEPASEIFLFLYSKMSQWKLWNCTALL